MSFSKQTIIKILPILCVVLLLLWVNYKYIDLSAEEIRNFINAAGWFSPVLYIVIYALRPFILFPASILSLAGGLLFGALLGTLLIITGATFGAVLSFLAAQKLGKNLSGKEWSGRGKNLQQQLEMNGFVYVLFIRLIPVFNFDMVSYLAGISRIKLKPFFFGTLFGIIPGASAYSFLGAGLVEGDGNLLFISAVLFVLISILPYLFKNKILNKTVSKRRGLKRDE
ncbi:TVP38/TMEM64 family protein [Alkalicoccus daliensis]|uniref:TVP38/TMEM64 family membrane protein n=1 Tax=Alkalicoccus daliensis TaxID=745820 RepID=A0A1H0I9Q2_9BACI|nr:VTT domain-containing protein [Alkalicoccus daliensis]SDO28122.1 Uncharacterized membrane protein YdjX, TVP38/TMEM64 family, SNARE-associated domain [Alkalicoccus daliensis]